MGKVYKAHDPNLDMNVALKVLHPERVDSDAFVKRFLREAKVLGRLDRANIIRIYNVDEDSGNIYIAMELVEGESLRDKMKKKKFSQDEIIHLGITIANALDYAHDKGVVHRDIKPSNILIRSDNFIKITDFGIAHIQDPDVNEKTQAGEILGTPSYMSPEQVKGISVDGRSDIFSLGIILYELLAGERPFKGNNISAIYQAVLNDTPQAVSDKNPGVNKGLSDAIMKCLNKKPEERFQTGTEMADALETFKEDLDGETVIMQGAASSPKSGKGLVIALIIILSLAVAGGLIYFKDSSISTEKEVTLSHININSAPVPAQIYIDGLFKGNSPLGIDLPVGKHEIRITAPSYHDWEAQVTLKEGKEVPLNIRLIPMKDPGT